MQEKEADEMNERRQSKSSRQQISYVTSDYKKTILKLISSEHLLGRS